MINFVCKSQTTNQHLKFGCKYYTILLIYNHRMILISLNNIFDIPKNKILKTCSKVNIVIMEFTKIYDYKSVKM